MAAFTICSPSAPGTLLRRVGLGKELTFIGGVARQQGMVKALESRLGITVHVPEDSDYVCAVGAAFEARSQQHALTIDVVAPGSYRVRVTDIPTGELLLDQTVRPSASSGSAEASADVRDLHVFASVAESHDSLVGGFEVEQGGKVIDSVRATWALAPQPAPLHAPGAFRIGGDVKAPQIINRVEPKYTDKAREARIAGVVIVQALVDKNGVVRDAVVLKPLPFGLSESALEAVKQWTFQPATRNGEPVDVIFNIVMNFKPQPRQ